MANRDYYGDNVPLNLIGEQESRQFPHPQTQIQSPDSRSAFGQFSNQNEHNLPSDPNTYEQDQTEWRDPTNPEYGPKGEEGEKGLGSTLVGGAGGAFVGHEDGKKSDHGVLGTIGGAIAGAFAANLASLPKGMGFHEYFKLTDEVDDSLAHYEKDEISLAYSKLTMDDIEKHFGIPREPVPLLFPSLGMPVPETLAKDLDDLCGTTKGSIENEALSRARINLILQGVLKERRRLAPPQAHTMHLGFETPLSSIISQRVILRGDADYTVWYTSHRKETNQLVIVEAKKARHVTLGLPQLLGYMGSVQVARRTAQKCKITVFGVLTDGYQWDFVYLNENSKYSLITFRWDSGQDRHIWDILYWMVACAEVQSPRGSDSS
ncbi:17 kDa surface antigen [Aspergillus oryzae]|uniref:17 kDa surface antigen n=1 Tax=Aspergillus oryzae TaxID=5062 RepID=A0A1S9DXA4_ASPOZ|nr:17 kDa surface antigen [Aspergillus oryzae]